jgi:mannose-6-phosphate isomerase-like protein (cupin superfamily)
MSPTARKLVGSLAFCALGFAAAWCLIPSGYAADKPPALLKSKIVGWEEAKQHQADWGQMRFYFTGETAGTKNVLTAVAVVEPGKAVHKSHRHAEEEYLVLVEGSGIWSLAGKESPANRGDVLFVEPWVYHGLKNTGDKPLIFLVVRYTAKGLPVPPRPDNKPDET